MRRAVGFGLLAALLAFVCMPVATAMAAGPTAAPGAPTGVTATAGTMAATVTWVPSGQPASSFTVTSNPGGITSTVDGGTTSATVSGLGFGLAYTFAVQGVNVIGAGTSSAASNAVTPLAPGGQYQQGLSFALFNGNVTAGHPQGVSLGANPITVTGLSAVVVNVITSNATTASSVQLAVNQQVVQTVAAPVGQVDSNLIFVAVPPSLSQAALSVTAGTVHVELDFVGFVTGPKQFPNHAGMLRPIQPALLFNGTVATGSTTHIPVLGQGDVPAANVSEVLLNVTASSSAAAGSLAVEASGLPSWFPQPATTLGFASGQTTANRAIVAVGSDGSIALLDKGAAASVRVEAIGWFTSAADTGALGSLFSPTATLRLFNSTANGGPVAAGSAISFAVRGQGGVPSSNASAPATGAMFQVTAVSPLGTGSISFAGASAIDFTAGNTTSGLVIVPLGTDGAASFTVSGAATNVTVDLVGYFSGDLIVPGSTKVLTPALLAAITGIGSDYSVTFAPGTQVNPFVQLNDVIVAGVSPTTPTGFLLRVLSITTLPSGAVVLGTRIALLTEVFTAFTLDWSLPPTAGLFGMMDSSPRPLVAAPLQSSSNPFPPPVGTSIDPKYPSFAIARPGTSLQFTPAPWAQFSVDDLEVQMLPHFHFEYNFFTGSVKAAFAFSVGVRIALTDTITKDFTLLSKELYRHLFHIGNPQWTLLGDVPVVYWPEITVTLNLDATISVGLSTTYHLDKWAQATVAYDNGKWSAGEQTAEYANGFDPPSVVATADAQLSLHVIPGIQFDLVLTSGTDISPYIKASVTPNTLTPPWWTLSAGICIGVAESLDLLLIPRVDFSQTFACVEVVLLHAPGLMLNVVISPTSASIPRLHTQHLGAGVPGSNNGVIWSVEGGAAAGTLSNTTVTDTDYTAPNVPGTYKVKAAAIDDPSSFSEATITVTGSAPIAPTGVTAVAGPNSALVSWSPPADNGGTALTGYDVTDVPDGTTFHVDASLTSLTVPNLTPGSTYTFTVTATNQAGLTSAPSTPSPPITIPAAVPLSVTPASLDFGSQPLLQTSLPKTVTVQAGASAALKISTITFTGLRPQDFAIQSDSCSGQTVPAGGTCTFDAVYTSNVQGFSSAIVNVNDDDASSPQKVAVQGAAPLPVLSGFKPGVAQFLDAQHGFINQVTSLLVTSDAGQTWTRLPAGSGIALAGGFHFVDASNGWALGPGRALTPGCFANCLKIFRTTDGGVTWSWISTIPNLQSKGLWFADQTHGWVIGTQFLNTPSGIGIGRNSMFATVDGGLTWTLQSLPDSQLSTCTLFVTEQIAGVRFVDAAHGWAIGAARCEDLPSQTVQSQSTFAWSTSNGGATWTAHDLGVSVFFDSPLQVVSATQIRFAAVTQNGNGSQVLFSTDDGGANFSQLPLPTSANDVEFVDASHAVLLGGFPGATWVTVDGGQTWTPTTAALPPLVLTLPSNPSTSVSYSSLAVADAMHWWVLGVANYGPTGSTSGGLVLVTPDGGASYLVQLVGDGT